MQDRGYIKWAPFNSLINDKKLTNEIIKRNNQIAKPVLSEDQINDLNEKIFEAYINHIKVNIYIYKNHSILNLNGFINNIDTLKKYITFNSIHIYFSQILKIIY